jgi:hypothetical protein
LKDQNQMDCKFDSPFYRAFTPRFRGGIAENCQRFRLMGGGYKAMPPEQNGHFWLSSARQLTGPLNALLDSFVRSVHVIGATQVLKSIIGDIWVPYVMEHIRQPMLVLFEDDPKADLFCSLRLMETLRNHPMISGMLAESKKENRHNVTGTWIKTLHSELLVAGLNDGNVSTLSWPYIWVSEAWQHGSDGLLFKAFKRADRFADSYKILNESQAAMAGTDLHRAIQGAHSTPLVWKCPQCSGAQTWEWNHWSYERPQEFTPLPNPGAEQPKPGSYGGMKWPDDAGGTRTIEDRARGAYWECIWCGHHIGDTKEERRQLCESYAQDYRTESNGVMLSPKQVVFTLPFEAAWDNRFEKTVANYLTAKVAKAHGNDTPLIDWFLAERAMFYDPRLTQTRINILSGSYNVSGVIPDEQVRVLGIDCQQGEVALKTGHFWWVARAVDKKGDLYQLGRGYATSWEEMIQIQRDLKISNDNVAIDGGNYLQEILDMAAQQMEIVEREVLHWRTAKPTGRKARVKSAWKVLRGNGVKRSFPHGGQNRRIFRSFSQPSTYQRQVTRDGQVMMVDIPVYEWSNLSVKDHLQNLMQGGPTMPKFIALKREQLTEANQAMEVGDRAYDKQMQNEYRTQVGAKTVWVESTPNVHYRDCECQCVVMFDMGGFLGLPAAGEE